jgi:hypothetical protein
MVLPGLEPGRRLTGTRFHTTSVFTAPVTQVRGLDCPFTVASGLALGAARPVSTPSLAGLARDRQ